MLPSWRHILLFAILLLFVTVQLQAASAKSHTLTVGAVASLDSVLKADGTLDLSTDFSGSFDARGWLMQTTDDGRPHFLRTGETLDTPATLSSAAGDENWDNGFGPPGFNSIGIKSIALNGNDVYVTGYFTMVNDITANYVAKWDGTNWSALGNGLNGPGKAIAVKDGNVYVGGSMLLPSSLFVPYLAKWDGSSWSFLDIGGPGLVSALAVDGTDLYVGGQFRTVGGQPVNDIAKWDGANWTPLATSVTGPNGDYVQTLAVLGSDLYMAGNFYYVNGTPAQHLAKLSNGTWSQLGLGFYDDGLNQLVVHDGVLYAASVGPMFGSGFPKSNIATWNGSSWDYVGAGSSGGPYGAVNALAFDGTTLYAGGDFYEADGILAYRIAKWDGSNWSALGSGILGGSVQTLALTGTNLYAGGWFDLAGGKPSIGFARWFTSPPAGSADLGISATAQPDSVQVGQVITYTAVVTNNGPDLALNGLVTDALPNGLTYRSATATHGSCSGTSTIACNLGVLVNSQTVTVVIAVTTTLTGSVVNSLGASTYTNDPAADNNSATITTTVTAIPQPVADLALTVTDVLSSVQVGSALTYTIHVLNNGPDSASNVQVGDVLPAGLAYRSATGSQGACSGSTSVTCALGSVASSGSATVTLVATTTQTGVLTNTLAVSSDTLDPSPGNNSQVVSATVTAPPPPPSADIFLSASGAPAAVLVGEAITYTVSITNRGPDPALNVQLTDVLPAGLTYQSAASWPGSCSGTTNVTCSIGTLAPGGAAQAMIAATASRTGALSNTLTLSSSTPDPDSVDNTAVVTTTVSALPSFGIYLPLLVR